jgi:hypothetical protein
MSVMHDTKCSRTNRIRQIASVTRYRFGQGCQHLGLVKPLTNQEHKEVERWLPAGSLWLFHSMSIADQRHSLRVCLGLRTRGCVEDDMLAAALLHDVGKAQGRAPFWTRPAIVLAKTFAPALLTELVPPLEQLDAPAIPRWRRSLGYAWWHAEVGAALAARAGLSERVVLYIRTHHQPAGPAAELHLVDEVS